MKNVFDITDFGAVGDGLTDCTAAIQRALDAAAEAEGAVIVPPGRYCTGTLKMGKRTRLQGYSAWNFRADGSSVLLLNDPEAVCLLDITGAFGCSVAGLCLDGRKLGKKVHGIYLYWEKYNGGSEEDTPTVDDCRVGNFTGDGLHLEHIWCFSVRHTQMFRNGGAGLYIDGWDGFILDNWFSGNKNGGILGGPTATSLTATGNRVEWNRVGGFVIPAGVAINITGNYFDRSGGPALKLGSAEGEVESVTITGNFIYRSGKPGEGLEKEDENSHVLMDHCVNVTFTGNTFRYGRDDNGKGIWSPDIDMVIRNCNYCIFAENAMHHGALKENIRWDGTGNCRFEGNIGEPVGEA